MVMDAAQPQPPSPQSVGREFVRQYYTLLNKAPNHLHRFYTNNSSFIHDESTLVIGQKNIYDRIQQMNFHDCHAKISQVDSQATLGNGVVVQVTGELSNDGQPMRRFTQTFVLAQQTPKKYYVHNDIFRYQDIYTDDDMDGETRSEIDEELLEHKSVDQTHESVGNLEQRLPAVVQQQITAPSGLAESKNVLSQSTCSTSNQLQGHIYYPLQAPVQPVPVISSVTARSSGVPISASYATSSILSSPQPHNISQSSSQLNGVGHEKILTVSTEAQLQTQQAVMPEQPLSNSAQTSNLATGQLSGSNLMTPTSAIKSSITTGGTNAPRSAGTIATDRALPQDIIISQTLQSQLIQQKTNMQSNNSVTMLNQSNNILNDDEDNTHLEHKAEISDSSIPSASKESSLVTEDLKAISEQQHQEKFDVATQNPTEPKTYANLLKSSASSPSGFVTAAMQQQQQIQQQSQNTFQQSPSSISSSTFSQSIASTGSIYNNRNDNFSVRIENNQGQSGPLPPRTNTRTMKDFEQRRPSNVQFSDSQQLFLGNLPHHASEDDLKNIFARFGTVVELRILTKASNKMAPGIRNPLNYGFITYEDAESVQTCLANLPLYFPENSPDGGQKLNVEEKKPRIRSSEMQTRQINNNLHSNMGNSQRTNMSSSGSTRTCLPNNSGNNIRNTSNANANILRGNNNAPRLSGGFNRNDNHRSGVHSGGNVQQSRNVGNNNIASSGGSNTYGQRR